MAAPVPTASPGAVHLPGRGLLMGLPRPALALAAMLGGVGLIAASYVAVVPFDTAAFGA